MPSIRSLALSQTEEKLRAAIGFAGKFAWHIQKKRCTAKELDGAPEFGLTGLLFLADLA
jgi:hypothetical protein